MNNLKENKTMIGLSFTKQNSYLDQVHFIWRHNNGD